MIEIEARLDELGSWASRAACAWSAAPRARACVLDGKPVLLLCSNNYLGLADHPRVREAAADAAMRWGVGAGASRLVVGHDDDPPPAGGAARAFKRTPGARCCSAPATSRTSA